MSTVAALKWLVVLALALPVVRLLLEGVELVLAALGDTTGALVVSYIGLALVALWLMIVTGLVILVALHSFASHNERDA